MILYIREDLLHYDEAKRRGLLREEEERSTVARDQWERNPSDIAEIDQNDLTTPLMSDTNDSQNTNHSSKWWEDDNNGNSSENNDDFFTEQPTPNNIEKEEQGSWLSRLSKRMSSKRESTESYSSSGQQHHSLERNNDDFSPVNSDIEFQASFTANAKEGYSDSNHTPVPPWMEDDKKDDTVSAPKDLSWAQDT